MDQVQYIANRFDDPHSATIELSGFVDLKDAVASK
jgi:hypothetical protein